MNEEIYVDSDTMLQAEKLSAEFERDRRRYGRELTLEGEDE